MDRECSRRAGSVARASLSATLRCPLPMKACTTHTRPPATGQTWRRSEVCAKNLSACYSRRLLQRMGLSRAWMTFSTDRLFHGPTFPRTDFSTDRLFHGPIGALVRYSRMANACATGCTTAAGLVISAAGIVLPRRLYKPLCPACIVRSQFDHYHGLASAIRSVQFRPYLKKEIESISL